MSDDEEDHLHDYELARFVFDLHKAEPVQMLARGQAHIEHALRQFILANAAAPQHVSLRDLGFEEIVSLGVILGLNAEIKPALSALTALQTKFGVLSFGEKRAIRRTIGWLCRSGVRSSNEKSLLLLA